jgi:glucose-6-phosphate dehydrogenase assembly protein OpcA
VEETVKVARTAPLAVALDGLHGAIGTLWRQCQAEQPDGNVTRSLILNLVAVTVSNQEADVRKVLERLYGRLPCRVFLVVLDAGERVIRAEVSGVSNVSARGREIVLEEIDLRMPWQLVDKVSGLVRPLLVNDVPTHMFWSSNLPEAAQQFDSLAKLADHVIVDSAQFQSAMDVERLLRRGDRAQITDLTWLRMRPWRRALAEAFERFPWQQGAPTRVTIQHGPDMGATAGAMLLGHWLEEKLTARVFLEEAGDGAIGQLTLELRHADVLVQIAQDESAGLSTSVTTAASCFLPFTVPASRGHVGNLLAAAIDLA